MSGSLEHGFYLGWVYFNPSLSHHKAKKFPRVNAKYTFEWVKFHVIFLHQPKLLFQMLYVFCAGFAFDDYVINIHLHSSVYKWFKKFHHQSLVRCSCILKPKRHDIVVV